MSPILTPGYHFYILHSTKNQVVVRQIALVAEALGQSSMGSNAGSPICHLCILGQVT